MENTPNPPTDEVCPICQQQPLREPVKLNCGHVVCWPCIYTWAYSRWPLPANCTECREDITSVSRAWDITSAPGHRIMKVQNVYIPPCPEDGNDVSWKRSLGSKTSGMRPSDSDEAYWDLIPDGPVHTDTGSDNPDLATRPRRQANLRALDTDVNSSDANSSESEEWTRSGNDDTESHGSETPIEDASEEPPVLRSQTSITSVASENTCAICFDQEESLTEPCHLGCRHVFCWPCIFQNVQTSGKDECPICRRTILKIVPETTRGQSRNSGQYSNIPLRPKSGEDPFASLRMMQSETRDNVQLTLPSSQTPSGGEGFLATLQGRRSGEDSSTGSSEVRPTSSNRMDISSTNVGPRSRISSRGRFQFQPPIRNINQSNTSGADGDSNQATITPIDDLNQEEDSRSSRDSFAALFTDTAYALSSAGWPNGTSRPSASSGPSGSRIPNITPRIPTFTSRLNSRSASRSSGGLNMRHSFEEPFGGFSMNHSSGEPPMVLNTQPVTSSDARMQPSSGQPLGGLNTQQATASESLIEGPAHPDEIVDNDASSQGGRKWRSTHLFPGSNLTYMEVLSEMLRDRLRVKPAIFNAINWRELTGIARQKNVDCFPDKSEKDASRSIQIMLQGAKKNFDEDRHIIPKTCKAGNLREAHVSAIWTEISELINHPEASRKRNNRKSTTTGRGRGRRSVRVRRILPPPSVGQIAPFAPRTTLSTNNQLQNTTSISQENMSPSNDQPRGTMSPSNNQPHGAMPPSNNQPHGAMPPSNNQPHGAMPPSNNQPHDAMPPSNNQPHGAMPPSNNQPHGAMPPSNNQPHGAMSPSDNQPNGALSPFNNQSHNAMSTSNNRPHVTFSSSNNQPHQRNPTVTSTRVNIGSNSGVDPLDGQNNSRASVSNSTAQMEEGDMADNSSNVHGIEIRNVSVGNLRQRRNLTARVGTEINTLSSNLETLSSTRNRLTSESASLLGGLNRRSEERAANREEEREENRRKEERDREERRQERQMNFMLMATMASRSSNTIPIIDNLSQSRDLKLFKKENGGNINSSPDFPVTIKLQTMVELKTAIAEYFDDDLLPVGIVYKSLNGEQSIVTSIDQIKAQTADVMIQYKRNKKTLKTEIVLYY